METPVQVINDIAPSLQFEAVIFTELGEDSLGEKKKKKKKKKKIESEEDEFLRHAKDVEEQEAKLKEIEQR